MLRRYSYSDRMRYYWPDPEVARGAGAAAGQPLRRRTIPLPLLSQHLPAQYERVRDGQLDATPEALVLDHVKDVLRTYAAACTTGPTAEETSR